jgi:hypothetical protein
MSFPGYSSRIISDEDFYLPKNSLFKNIEAWKENHCGKVYSSLKYSYFPNMFFTYLIFIYS